MGKRWTYNAGVDTECWEADEYFSTRDEAIEAARQYAEEQGNTFIQVGLAEPFWPALPDVERLIDDAIDQVYDNVGSNDHAWDPTHAQKEDLQRRMEAVWNKWIDDHRLKNLVFLLSCEETISLDQLVEKKLGVE